MSQADHAYTTPAALAATNVVPLRPRKAASKAPVEEPVTSAEMRAMMLTALVLSLSAKQRKRVSNTLRVIIAAEDRPGRERLAAFQAHDMLGAL